MAVSVSQAVVLAVDELIWRALPLMSETEPLAEALTRVDNQLLICHWHRRHH